MDTGSTITEFYTDRCLRFAEWTSVCLGIVLNMLVAAGFAFVLGLILSVLGMPIWLCAWIGVAFTLCYFAWSVGGVTSRLRFCLILHADCVQLGAGLLRLNIPYEEVELFGYARKAKDDCLIVLWRGHRSHLFLPRYSFLSCLNLLRERCVNAIFLDSMGREHLPPKPTKPDFSLDTLYRQYRTKALTSLSAVVVLFLVVILAAIDCVVRLFGVIPQKNVLDAIDPIHLLYTGSLAAFGFFWAYRRYAKKAQYIYEGLVALRNGDREQGGEAT
jgi:hypothetical protein